MKLIKKPKPNQLAGYILLALYAVAAIVFVGFCANLKMLPSIYLIILGITFVILALILLIMHKKLVSSIISSILTIVFIIGMIAGTFMLHKTASTLQKIISPEKVSNITGVYVLKDDPAQKIEDAKEYKFGIVSDIDTENTQKSIAKLESSLNVKLDIQEYDNIFAMMDELKDKKIGALILNSAYIDVIGDEKDYSWVRTDLREIASFSHEEGGQQVSQVPSEVPETFIMYLSGIDTFGRISARSRSDVNILAVVNTKTKNILLLSTPRDYYVDYSVTSGAKDKLTHAGIYGIDASMDALEKLYGIDINYYLRVNFSGFVDVINALGGVDVNSDYDFSSGSTTFHVGTNHLTGEEALSFARERYSFEDGDFQRAKNQMEVIRAVIAKSASASLLTNYSSVMDAVAGSIDTNMPQEHIASLVKMQLSNMAQWNVTSYTSTGTSTSAETYSMPGRDLYVIVPDEASIKHAKELIQTIYD